MTKASKVLAIFLCVASLAFMGFAGVATLAGPNWTSLAGAEDLRGFTFAESDGEETTWTVEKIEGENRSVVSGAENLPKAIIAARKARQADLEAEDQALKAEITRLEAKLKEVQQLVELDLQAIDSRRQGLVNTLAQMDQASEDLSRQIVQQSQEAQKNRIEANARREDVMRLANQLAEIRTDRFRAIQQQAELRDLLYRLQGQLAIAQRTNTLLKESGARLPYEESPTEPPPAESTDGNSEE